MKSHMAKLKRYKRGQRRKSLLNVRGEINMYQSSHVVVWTSLIQCWIACYSCTNWEVLKSGGLCGQQQRARWGWSVPYRKEPGGSDSDTELPGIEPQHLSPTLKTRAKMCRAVIVFHVTLAIYNVLFNPNNSDTTFFIDKQMLQFNQQ